MQRRDTRRRAVGAPLPAHFAVFFLALVAGMATAQPDSDSEVLEILRARFPTAVDSMQETEQLFDVVARGHGTAWEAQPPVIAAYYAGLVGLMGKHERSPTRKLRHIREATSIFDALVASHPRDLEVRYLRYSLYEQLPRFFRTRDRALMDLETVISGLEEGPPQSISDSLCLELIGYILTTDPPTDEQRRRLEAARLAYPAP
jgi:hypothetical protein